MNETIILSINKYAKMLFDGKYLRSGYIAVAENDGMYITKPAVNYSDIKEEDVAFVSDKTIESLEGNFRAAAVILFCALRSKKNDGAGAIVDSESILAFSAKRKSIKPILDDMTQIDGISVKCAAVCTAAEVVNAISGMRDTCFLPDAGAVVLGRTLDEVYTATLVLDKAANAEILAESKGGTKPMKLISTVLEHVVFKLKYSKSNQKSQKAAEKGEKVDIEEKPSAITTDELKKIAQDIKNAGVKLLEDNLVQGTWGNIAVRVDDNKMLATPSALDYIMLKPEQMALVDMTTLEWTGSNKATSEKGIHAILMLADKNICATVHTHPYYGSIIAATGKALPVPEKYRSILGDSIPCAKHGLPGTKTLVKNVAAAIGNSPACLLANHGVIVRAKDLDEAFVICRALEDACKDYLLDK